MAEEDKVRETLGAALTEINRIPRPTVRQKILWDTMQWCAAALGVTLLNEIPLTGNDGGKISHNTKGVTL